MYAGHILRRPKIGKTANRARFGEKKRAGCWILDTGYWVLDSEKKKPSSIQYPAPRILKT